MEEISLGYEETLNASSLWMHMEFILKTTFSYCPDVASELPPSHVHSGEGGAWGQGTPRKGWSVGGTGDGWDRGLSCGCHFLDAGNESDAKQKQQRKNSEAPKGTVLAYLLLPFIQFHTELRAILFILHGLQSEHNRGCPCCPWEPVLLQGTVTMNREHRGHSGSHESRGT
jgi:hypothetical protein